MFWIRSGLHSISISDWLTAGPAPAPDPSAALRDAREAMLDALGEAGGRTRATLQLRIRNARDARDLWHLRPALMDAVAQMHGEWEGRKRLAEVTQKFEQLLPEARAGRRGRAPASAAAR